MSVRLDKWLIAARLYKTRTLAQEACSGGHVHVNERAAVPAHAVKYGDSIVAKTPGGTRMVEVIALGEKRSTAEYARSLYVDHTPAAPPPPEPLAERDRGAGRPTKRDRRLTDLIRERELD